MNYFHKVGEKIKAMDISKINADAPGIHDTINSNLLGYGPGGL